ncbi:MAG: CBS domain-containing protein [Nitrospiria bacterium]
MSIRKIVHREVESLEMDARISDVAAVMRNKKIGSVFIKDRDHYKGIVTESDMVRKVLTKEMSYDTAASEIMGAPLVEIDIEKSVMEANHMMHFHSIRHLSISEKGEIIGLISVRDIVRFFSGEPKGSNDLMANVYKPLTILVHRDIASVKSNVSCRDAAEIMEKHRIGSLLIPEENRYSGIITEVDMVRKLIGFDLNPSEVPVGVIMNTPVIDIDIASSVQSATDLMSSKGIRHLGVSEGGNIVGILSIRDLIGMISVRDLPQFFAKKPS